MQDETPPKPKRKLPPKMVEKMIKKGEVRNPLGGNANKELVRIRALTSLELAEGMSYILGRSVSDVKKMAAGGAEFTALQVWVANLALEGIRKKSNVNFETLLNRVVGPVKQKIELTPGNPFEGKTPEQLQAEISKLEELKKLL